MHPIFGADVRLLQLGLLYVVMCRTDYRGPVPWENITSDRFISCFLQEMEKNSGLKTIVQVRQSARKSIQRQGSSRPSHWDLLFESIEKKAFVRKRNHPNAPDPIPIFQVTTEDLASLHKSINTVRVLGLPVFWLVAIFTRLIDHSISDWGAPHGRLELYRLIKGVELRKRRQRVIHERKEAAGADPVIDAAADFVDPAADLGIDPSDEIGVDPASPAPDFVVMSRSSSPTDASSRQVPAGDNSFHGLDENQRAPALGNISEDQIWSLLGNRLRIEAANIAKAAVEADKADIFNDDGDVMMDIGGDEEP